MTDTLRRFGQHSSSFTKICIENLRLIIFIVCTGIVIWSIRPELRYGQSPSVTLTRVNSATDCPAASYTTSVALSFNHTAKMRLRHVGPTPRDHEMRSIAVSIALVERRNVAAFDIPIGRTPTRGTAKFGIWSNPGQPRKIIDRNGKLRSRCPALIPIPGDWDHNDSAVTSASLAHFPVHLRGERVRVYRRFWPPL